MGRKRLDQTLEESQVERLPIEDMPLESLEDYLAYNAEARKLNKKLKLCRYPIQQCPEELHRKVRVIIQRSDGHSNLSEIPVLLSNEKIHFSERLKCGKEYDLPECVVDFLSEKGYPVWDWVTKSDGSKETRQVNMNPRFSIRTIRNRAA